MKFVDEATIKVQAGNGGRVTFKTKGPDQRKYISVVPA